MDNLPAVIENDFVEDWDVQDDNVRDVTKDSSNANNSMSASMKQLMFQKVEPATTFIDRQVVGQDTQTVLELAANQGLTLQNFVQENPDYAVKVAERVLANWLAIQSVAALEGKIETENGTYDVTREQTRLISDRVKMATEQLDTVREYAFTAYRDGEQKKDLLQRVMFRRALNGDVRMAMYMHDRIEGRPTEARVAETDYDNAYNVYMIIHVLFDKQLEVLNAGNGTHLVCCSRRAGKTVFLVAVILIECLRRPNTKCIYIGETAELSEQLFDTAANMIIDSCNLKDKRGKRLNWKKFDNGSSVLIRGLSNTKDPDQIRGHSAKIIVIDEFFHLKSELLEYMQREVLQPMQLDHADDYKFICAGTPPSIKDTYGEYAWKNWACPHYFWTWEDNPHPVAVEARKAYIERVLAEKGLDWTSSFARREYGGEWVYDEDILLYGEYHTYDPREGWPQFKISRIFFGIDYGVSDHDVLVGVAWDDDEQRGYVFIEEKFSRLDIRDRTVSQLDYLRKCVRTAWRHALDFFPTLTPYEANKRVFWDADDNDQHLTDDLNINARLTEKGYEDLKLNIRNAHKTDKVMMFDKIRDLLRTAGLLVPYGGKTEHEILSTVLRRGPNGQIYPEVDDKVYHPDILPALRYALVNVLG